MGLFSRLRRSVALIICPQLRPSAAGAQQCDRDLGAISALLALCDAFQAETAISDWEIASRAGVNNRAIKILRGGAGVSAKTAARLFEYFEEAWPKGARWPLDEEATARFGTVLTIPIIEMLGGHDAMLALVIESGRKRTKDAVQSWARRAGMPEYARQLAARECERRGIAITASDFEPSRLTPAQIERLRPPKFTKKEAA